MSEDAQPVMLTVLAGTFSNQAEAFEALRQEAWDIGESLGPHQTDVIREASEVRMTHYFRPAVVARLEEARDQDDTLLVLFPSSLTAEPRFPFERSKFRLLGRYAGLLSQKL